MDLVGVQETVAVILLLLLYNMYYGKALSGFSS